MKKIYYQVVENVLPQVYLLYNSFNNNSYIRIKSYYLCKKCDGTINISIYFSF